MQEKTQHNLDKLLARHKPNIQRQQPFTLSVTHKMSPPHLLDKCVWTVGRSWSTWTKPTWTRGEHANSTKTTPIKQCTIINYSLYALTNPPLFLGMFCNQVSKDKNYILSESASKRWYVIFKKCMFIIPKNLLKPYIYNWRHIQEWDSCLCKITPFLV